MTAGKEMHLPLNAEGEMLMMAPITRAAARTMPRFAPNKGVAKFLSPAFTQKLRELSKPIKRTAALRKIEEDKSTLTWGLYAPESGQAEMLLTGLAEIEYNPEYPERAGVRLATWRPEMRRRGIGRAAVRGLVYASLGGDHPFGEGAPLKRVRAVAYSKNNASLMLFRSVGFVTTEREDAEFSLPEDRAAGITSERTVMTMYNPKAFDPGGSLLEHFSSLRIIEWGEQNIRFPT